MQIHAKNCNVQPLYDDFKTYLVNHGVDIKNIACLCSDNTSVMLSAKNSFMTESRKNCPHLIIVPCVCHSLALVSKDAGKFIPPEKQSFVKGLPTYINESAKRVAILKEFQ